MNASTGAQGTPARSALDWSALLVEAVDKPGVISAAYSRFWNYSIGNQLLALFECALRRIEPGPIHTFKGWVDLGRHVKKGEKAISLLMPVQVRRTFQDAATLTGDGAERPPSTRTIFILRPRWFVLSQTEGADYVPTEIPQWHESVALHVLLVERASFHQPNGNIQGYALDRTIAISPVAALPHKTMFHELAHVVLGHTEELGRMDDDEITSRNLREVEAESVALICCESLGLDGAAQCRGYIQHWLTGETILPKSAQKIFKAADSILKAGVPAKFDDSNDW